ncbi:MAG: YfhO family protein [bacterium]|nr:YfhO family protein [bacterium]
MNKGLYPVLVFLFLPLLFFGYPLITGKIYFGEDYLWQFLPFHQLGVELITSGQLPLWNSYIYSGMPLFANGSFAWFYPTILFLIFCSQELAINLIYYLHIFIAGYFTYRVCRTLRLSRPAGVIAGITFMFSGNLITLIYPGHTMKLVAASLIPVIFYFFAEALHRKKLAWFIYTAIAVSIQIFSTHWQVCYYTWIGIFFYLIFYFIRFKILYAPVRNQVFQYLMILALLAIGLTAVQWLPFAEYSQWSTRAKGLSYQEATEASFPPEEWLSMILVSPFGDQVRLGSGSSYLNLGRFFSPAGVIPYIGRFNAPRTLSEYLGVLPFLLAGIGLIYSRRKYVWFFLGLMLFSLFLSLGKFNPVYPLVYQFIPGLKWLRVPAEILLLFSFSLAILAGTGVEYIMYQVYSESSMGEPRIKDKKKKICFILLTGLSLILFLIFVFLVLPNSKPHFNHFKLVITRFLFFTTIIGLQFNLMLFYLVPDEGNRNSNLTDNSQQPKLGRKYRLLTAAYLSLILIFLFDVGTAHAPYLQTMRLADFKRFVYNDPIVEKLKEDKTPYRILPLGNEMISNKWILPHIQSVYGYQSFPLNHYEQFWKASGFDNETLWQLLNVKYIISPFPIDNERLSLVYDAGYKVLYQFNRAYPRAWVVSGQTDARDSTATVKVVHHSANRIILQVISSAPGSVILSEIYYPGWKAKLDGQPVQIGVYKSLLRSLPIPEGEHQIEFVFSPFTFWLGAIVSGISIFGLGLLLGYARKKKI